jgi:hypothetical protein
LDAFIHCRKFLGLIGNDGGGICGARKFLAEIVWK